LRDPGFGQALLIEGTNALLEGEFDIGKEVLSDYIKATIGFEALAKATGTPVKSLMRMFGARGNPTAAKLFVVICHLQATSGMRLEVRAT
jgi:DNA-binding phage protein